MYNKEQKCVLIRTKKNFISNVYLYSTKKYNHKNAITPLFLSSLRIVDRIDTEHYSNGNIFLKLTTNVDNKYDIVEKIGFKKEYIEKIEIHTELEEFM